MALKTSAVKTPTERVGVMELSGRPATIIGDEVKVGQPAPHFTSQVGVWPGKDLWSELDPLAATAGSVRILAAVPSLDTSTCDLETRRFNTEAAHLGPQVHIITISADLPVAQKRWCGAAGVERVYAVSDHMAMEFGLKYGALMKERRWLRRAVFVVDQRDVIRYVAYMPKLGDQPDYDQVMATASGLLAAEGLTPAADGSAPAAEGAA
jgi:thiol peroxidase